MESLNVIDVANTSSRTSISGATPSVSAYPPPAKEDWVSILGDWNRLRDEILRRLAAFHRSFAEPVKIVDGGVEIHERAMVAEKPYLIKCNDELLEFIRRADGSIVISEVLRLAK